MKKQIWLFLFGGAAYYLLELIWKGGSHWSMFLAGGLSFNGLTWIRKLGKRLHIFWQCFFGGIYITFVEFVCGCIVNLKMHWEVWDYSFMPFNILGQICLPFTFIWMLLCLPALWCEEFLSEKWDKVQTKRLKGNRPMIFGKKIK